MKDLQTLKKMFLQIFYMLNKRQRHQMFGMFFVIAIGSGFELLGVSAMMPFVEAIINPSILIHSKYIGTFLGIININGDFSLVLFVGILIVIIYFIKNIYLAFSAYLQAAYGNNTQRELSVLMLKSYMERPYSFFVNYNSGDILRGVSGDVYGVYSVILNSFKFLSESLTILLIIIYLFLTDWFLALGVCLVGVMCVLFILLGLKKRLTNLSILYRNASAEMNKWIVQSVNGIKDIMVFNRREYFIEGYDKSYANSNIANTNYTFACAIPERIIEAFCISGIVITVLVRLGLGVNTEQFVPQMAVFAMGAFRILPSISRITGYLTSFVYYRAMVDSTYENIKSARYYLSHKEELNEKDDELVNEFKRTIEVKNIVWRYDDGEKNVLNGLNMIIEKGQAIGIIGESGSGKSTFSDILLRLYKPISGSICMDGININNIHTSWSKIIGYIPQMVFLMDDTIRNNIIFGSEIINDEKVWEALDKASLGDFIRTLPEGLNTMVGERGVKLSGGQRQRIAIGRALYNNPQVLVLDEATSALDSDTEDAVMDAIDSLAGSVTLIIIAHRVTTLRNCDKIYEIKDGQAIERRIDKII